MFIAKNKDLIILAKDTREELEQALKFMVYTDIEETDINYELYNGQYLTPEEIEIKQNKERNQEIDEKIAELNEMLIPELVNFNTENIKIYKQVIAGLEAARP